MSSIFRDFKPSRPENIMCHVTNNLSFFGFLATTPTKWLLKNHVQTLMNSSPDLPTRFEKCLISERLYVASILTAFTVIMKHFNISPHMLIGIRCEISTVANRAHVAVMQNYTLNKFNQF